jgi:eukaryotic-like serine/threonine-protein kinase
VTCPPGMVEVSAGSFQMGSSASDPMRGFGELDLKATTVAAYCIDMYEYPNQRGKVPASSVTWTRAKQMCERQNKRLCTEPEWERACKGARNAGFPFGASFEAGVCNLGEGGSADHKPAAAGDFNRCRSSFGVADLAGNVAEWTGSKWAEDVPDRVVKGGGSDQAVYAGRCAARSNEAAGSKRENLGFRCCADLK